MPPKQPETMPDESHLPTMEDARLAVYTLQVVLELTENTPERESLVWRIGRLTDVRPARSRPPG